MVDRQHVDFAVADQSVDDAVRTLHDFPDQRIFVLGNGSARFREWNQSICCGDEAGDDDRRVMRRVLADERVNRGQIGLRLLGPENLSHDRNCLLISSCDTSWRASD